MELVKLNKDTVTNKRKRKKTETKSVEILMTGYQSPESVKHPQGKSGFPPEYRELKGQRAKSHVFSWHLT